MIGTWRYQPDFMGMQMDSAEEVRRYWQDRAASDPTIQSTTNDVHLRDIEYRVIADEIAARKPRRVVDLGCGDGVTTLRLAARFPEIEFVGRDYAPAMIDNAKANLQRATLPNISFAVDDVAAPKQPGGFDFAYTNRCLINVPGWDDQKSALVNVAGQLTAGGTYAMVENFVDGHNAMNEVRRAYDLPEIKIRPHNFFFDEAELRAFIAPLFKVESFTNISSTYYLTTRVIYSALCKAEGREPDYFNAHHKLAAGLPFAGNFGPIKLMVLKKP